MTIGINPYTPNMPVRPSHFAGRQAEINALRGRMAAARDGYPTSVFLQGEWGIGKTSLLSRLKPEFSEYGVVIREDVLEGSAEDQTRTFFKAVFDDLLAENRVDFDRKIINYKQPRVLRKMLITMMSALWRDKQLLTIIILDNLERAAPEFLAGVKDVFQLVGEDAPHYLLVFAGRSLPGAGENAADPIARFFQNIPVGPLNDDDAVEAIFRPIEVSPEFSISRDAALLIQHRAAGHPYFLKQICHQVFAIAEGRGAIEPQWLEEHWPEIERGLEGNRFGNEFANLPDAEQQTLLNASLSGVEFGRAAIPRPKGSTLDTALRRLTRERGLLLQAGRGVYRFYHPLFHAFVTGRARAAGITPQVQPAPNVTQLIAQGENGEVEFKQSLEADAGTGRKNRALVEAALKTIAGFANGNGGTLMIGVADDGKIVGLAPDIALLTTNKRNRDGFNLKLQQLVRENLKPKLTGRITVRFEAEAGRDVCIVDVRRQQETTYLGDRIYVRDGPQTVEVRPGPDVEQFLRARNRE